MVDDWARMSAAPGDAETCDTTNHALLSIEFRQGRWNNKLAMASSTPTRPQCNDRRVAVVADRDAGVDHPRNVCHAVLGKGEQPRDVSVSCQVCVDSLHDKGGESVSFMVWEKRWS